MKNHIIAAYVISAFFVLSGLTIGILDAITIDDSETNTILRECGINPMNGEWISK